MSIVSSTHEIGPVQLSGRVWVTETHVDHLGQSYLFQYDIEPGADYVAIRTARAAQVNEMLAEREASQVLES